MLTSNTIETQLDSEPDHPHTAQQKQHKQHQEQEPEHVVLLQTTNQRHLARQQRISMSSIMTVDTSSLSQGGFFTCSSPTTAASSSCTSPMSALFPTSPSSVSFQDSYPTNTSSNYHHSRRMSSSVSSSLLEWHQLAHSNNLLLSNPALPVPVSLGSVAPIPTPVPAPATRRQQQRGKHKSQTSESDGQTLPFPSRPNSFASSYQPVTLSRKNSQRSQQQRQLGPGTVATTTLTLTDGGNNQYEKESNAAFERICSLLNHLITDASTAVSTVDGKDTSGAAVAPPIVIPRYLPMVNSESENSDEEVEGVLYLEVGEVTTTAIEDDGIDGGESMFIDEPESPRDQIRRRIDDSRKKRLARNRTGSYTADPSKRTSLFLELQNLQVEPEGAQHLTTPVLGRQGADTEGSKHHRTSSSIHSAGIGISAGRTSLDAARTATLLSPTTPSSRSLDFEFFDSELGSPITLTTPRRRNSFPPRRSDRLQIQRAEELQRVIQHVDAELDRTVQTIDDLTRDLVAVATHQNWMKTHLERTLGIQSPLSLTDFLQKDDDNATFTMLGLTGTSPMSPTSSTSSRGRLEQMEDIIDATKALLSSREFANYYQVLERVRIMEEQEDREEHYEQGCGEVSDLFGGRVDIDSNTQQRLSGSSFTLTNGSFRHSASSTLSLETRFGSYADFKDGALLSSSSRPSIEWSDRVGTQYSSHGHGLIQEKIHSLIAAPSPVHQQQQQGPEAPLELSSSREQSPIVEQSEKQEQEQHNVTDISTVLLQTKNREDSLSPNDATLAIDKLILASTHILLLLFWTMALILGVVITDGSILDNAGRQLITSVEILQSQFTIRVKDSLLAEQLRDGNATLEQEQEQEREQEAAVPGSAPKPSRPCSTRRRTRPSQRYHSHTHHHHKHLHRRDLSSIFPQINAPAVFGGSIGGRFYNSPFLASSRYGVDISHKEPRTIQLGPLSVAPASASASASGTKMTMATMLAPVLPASFSSSCSSPVRLIEDSELSVSTASSSATLLDWLDSTAATTDKKEVQALLNAHNNIDTTSPLSS